ncbi:OB-fold putative lipoprotein [Aliarcobacter butzleri]|uniref:OB-fold putative lipoprotein n=1 Tax=Aliarcobacter butzleri TaxID=28197 RepID=UPI0021B21B3A|nr:OB-fold putative lipoprotein [Aliarcobacter butzleri]MCT7601282.1 OB-fold putative lipoprotein [Aliarcobacter butzleri]
MALLKCKECGNEISKSAKTCPQCGAKVKMSFSKKVIIFIMGIAIFIAVFSGDKPNTTAKGQTVLSELEFNMLKSLIDEEIDLLSKDINTDTVIVDDTKIIEIPKQVTADKLQREYEKNEVKADSEYKNQSLLISATVDNIRKDFIDNLVIDLRAGNSLLFKPTAEVNKDYQGWVSSLNSGNRIQMVCKNSGMTVGAVYLKDCKPFYNWLVNQDAIGKLIKMYNTNKDNSEDVTVKLINKIKATSQKLNLEKTNCKPELFDSKKCFKEIVNII